MSKVAKVQVRAFNDTLVRPRWQENYFNLLARISVSLRAAAPVRDRRAWTYNNLQSSSVVHSYCTQRTCYQSGCLFASLDIFPTEPVGAENIIELVLIQSHPTSPSILETRDMLFKSYTKSWEYIDNHWPKNNRPRHVINPYSQGLSQLSMQGSRQNIALQQRKQWLLGPNPLLQLLLLGKLIIAFLDNRTHHRNPPRLPPHTYVQGRCYLPLDDSS